MNVRALRERLSWSQSELARFLAVSEGTVSRWETDDREPTGRTLDDLTALERVVCAATPEQVKAIRDAARRGETCRTMVVRGLEALTKKEVRRGGT